MAKMVLGNYVFDKNPESVSDLMTPVRYTAAVKTYGGVAFFSWGSMRKGKEIELHWGGVTTEQYDEMESQYIADIAVPFTPNDGSGLSYQVQMTKLNGKYVISTQGDWRQDVNLSLLIMDEGSVI